jgi:hypothetical protein
MHHNSNGHQAGILLRRPSDPFDDLHERVGDVSAVITKLLDDDAGCVNYEIIVNTWCIFTTQAPRGEIRVVHT